MARYLYIDVGSLRGFARNTLRKYFNVDETPRFDLSSLVQGFDRAFYYDAFPIRQHGENEAEYEVRTQAHRNAIESALKVDNLHVYEGDLRNRSRKRGPEQKMVDVMLTVDMMRHAYQGTITHATILASDQDFAPLIDAVVGSGVSVTVLYPPNETSGDLVRAADLRRPIGLSTLFSWIHPDDARRFGLPRMENRSPRSEPDGAFISAWLHENRIACRLFRAGTEWLVTYDSDDRNRLHVWSQSIELLNDMLNPWQQVPPEALAKASEFLELAEAAAEQAN